MTENLIYWFGEFDLTAVAIYTLVVQLLAIVAAMEAIMKTRTSQGAIAWSLSLLLMPTLMLPLYWIFGRRKFRGYAKARRLNKSGLQLPRTAALEIERFEPTDALERIAQMPFMEGNRLELLINGEQTFAALFKLIDEARQYVLLEYYIVRDDIIGEQLLQKLSAKAQQGIAVYFLYDEVGSFQLGRAYVNRMRANGVDMRAFNSRKGRRNRFQLNFRNHRKIVIADGAIGMVGGNNIGDEYLDKHPILTPWRDTSLAIHGNAVLALQLTFLEDWYWVCEQVPQLIWARPDEAAGEVAALLVPSGPADQLETCSLLFQQLIHSAQKRLWIVSPYFVPDSAILMALQLAALRGADVRIMLPEKPDKRMVWLSSFASLNEVQQAGVRVYRYQAGFLHQKVWLIDDDCALIGTANLDNRSLRLNFEVGVVARNRAFAEKIEAMLLNDFEHSRLLPEDELKTRGFLFQLAVRCSYLLAPIL
jgi:cardiolipin synthase A/B